MGIQIRKTRVSGMVEILNRAGGSAILRAGETPPNQSFILNAASTYQIKEMSRAAGNGEEPHISIADKAALLLT